MQFAVVASDWRMILKRRLQDEDAAQELNSD
jgi:hypothetical protein